MKFFITSEPEKTTTFFHKILLPSVFAYFFYLRANDDINRQNHACIFMWISYQLPAMQMKLTVQKTIAVLPTEGFCLFAISA